MTQDDTAGGAKPKAEKSARDWTRLFIWVPISAILGIVSMLLLEQVYDTGEWASLAGGFAVIIFIHIIFVDTLIEAHQPSTDRVMLMVNLAWCVAYILIFVAAYGWMFSLVALKGPDGEISGDLASAIYFSVITWTSVGYGEFTPNSSFARLLAGIEALNGYLIMAMFIATLLKTFERIAKPS